MPWRIDRAGVCGMYLEGIPREVAAMITAEVKAPTIGIGAGPDCDGQVLVLHDILNLTFAPPAKFVRRYGDAAALISNAVKAFKHDVETRRVSGRRGVVPPAERRARDDRDDCGTQARGGRPIGAHVGRAPPPAMFTSLMRAPHSTSPAPRASSRLLPA